MHWNTVSKLFHWAMAALILAAIALGLAAVNWDNAWYPIKSTLYSLHKSVGLTVLALGLLRLLWRLTHASPAHLGSHAAIERRAATAVHALLYGLLLLLPLSGWLLHSAAALKYPLTWFGIFSVPDIAPSGAQLQNIASWIHAVLFWVLAGLLLLHIGGALKHHWVDRDITLERMLPQKWLIAGQAVVYGLVALLISSITVAAVLFGINALQSDEIADDKPTAEQDHPEPFVDLAPETTAPRWTLVNPKQQALLFDFRVYGEAVTGQFKSFDWVLNFDPDNLEASRVRAVITIDSADTQDASRDDMLPNSDWFWAERYPIATFSADKFTVWLGVNPAGGYLPFIAHGQLTIRGVTKPLSLPFMWQQNGDQATLQASVDINRMDYAIGAELWPSDDDVGHKVTVRFDLPVQRLSE